MNTAEIAKITRETAAEIWNVDEIRRKIIGKPEPLKFPMEPDEETKRLILYLGEEGL